MKQQEIKKADQPKDFLRDCEIQISFHYDVLNEFDRIHDLVNRTNQLNFTKVRWSEDLETARRNYEAASKRQFNIHTGYIKVRDKFGYYGICGFFEFVVNSGRAIHFLFSCRVLNMGVEQFVYQTLKYPGINIQGTCVATLERKPVVDWITIVPDAEQSETVLPAEALTLCLHGPCELVQSAHYLRPYYNIVEEFQYPRAGWGIQRPLVRYIALGDEFKARGMSSLKDLGLSENFGGIDLKSFQSALLSSNVDVGLFSFSLESEIALYRHKASGLIIPFSMGKVKNAEAFELPAETIKEQNPNLVLEHIIEFQNAFEFYSLFNVDLLASDLAVLRGKLEASGKPFIVVEPFDDLEKIDHQKYRANKIINGLVRDSIGTLPGANFVKVADFVTNESQQIHINHFQREVYAQIGAKVISIVDGLKVDAKALPAPEQSRPLPATPIDASKKNLMAPTTSIIFLHIPKTAGQSVHHFLTYCVEKDKIAPARVNEQLIQMSIPEMRKYNLFSGHMDWSLLDCLMGPKFTFTVLREPVSRIVSFYLYLRREAQKLTPEQLQLPANAGKKAILTLSCDDYFSAGPAGMRAFLDNHYDNFYTYYFAGRRFDARQKLLGQQQSNRSFSNEKILCMALDNLALLDGVYPLHGLHLLERDIRALTGKHFGGPVLENLRVNTGDTDTVEARMESLEKLGATKITFDRIRKMTALDQIIWENFKASAETAPMLLKTAS
jgi:TolB-like protein